MEGLLHALKQGAASGHIKSVFGFKVALYGFETTAPLEEVENGRTLLQIKDDAIVLADKTSRLELLKARKKQQKDQMRTWLPPQRRDRAHG